MVQAESRSESSRVAELSGWRRWALLLVAPLVLIGPSLLPGKRFLPQLPTRHAPLAAENLGAASPADETANLLTADRILPFLTDQLEIRRQVFEGQLPLWEPNLGMGVPLLGGALVSPAYPPNWLAILFEPDRAAGWLAAWCLFIGGAGIWALARRRGLSPGAAAVGVVAFQTAGWALANLHYPMKVDAAVWLPWSLWAVEGLALEKRGAGFWLFLFSALSFLAGFVPIAVFCSLVVLAFGTWRWLDSREFEAESRLPARRPARLPLRVAIGLGLGLAGAGVQLFPTAEASQLSVRQEQNYERVASQSLPPAVAASLFVPDLFGGPDEFFPGPHPTAAWLSRSSDRSRLENFNSLEWNSFAGITVLALALVALFATPRRAGVPALLLIASWGFAQGWPMMRFFYHLPGLDLGAPGRALAVQWFLWPWLAALGTQAIIDRRPRAISTLLCLAFLFSTCAFLFWTGLDPAQWATELVTTVSTRFDLPQAEVAAILPEVGRLEAGQALRANSARVLGAACALFAAGLCALLLRRSPAAFGQGPPPWKLIFALLVVVLLFLIPLAASGSERMLPPLVLALAYLFVGGRSRNSVALAGWLPFVLVIGIEGVGNGESHLAPRQLETELFPESAAISAVARAAGDGRVLRLDESPGEAPEDVISLARPNLLEPYRISDLTPYMVFTPRTLVELFGALDPRTRYRSGISRLPAVELLDHPILDLTRVTALLSKRPLIHPRLELVYEVPNFHVYRRTNVPPAVHVVREAIEVASDEAALALLASGRFDANRQVVLAPGASADSGIDPSLGRRESLQGERVTPSRYDVGIESTAGGWLVFHEQYYPGWKATIDGRDAEVLRVNHAQRAVRVLPGEHVVRTKYEPWSLRFGALATLVSTLLAAWLAFRRSDKPLLQGKR